MASWMRQELRTGQAHGQVRDGAARKNLAPDLKVAHVRLTHAWAVSSRWAFVDKTCLIEIRIGLSIGDVN